MKLIPRFSKLKLSLRLRTKFMISITLMVCVLMAGTIFVVERQVRKTTTNEFIKLGIAISKNLSAVNTNYITTYNYVGIEQNVAKAVKDNNLAYA